MRSWAEGDFEVAPGVRLHYRRAGTGTPVVLAHGLLDDGACWTRTADVLAEAHDVVAYDARFHGASAEAPDAPWGGADDLISVVEALGLERPALIGHSMGGAVAAMAAASHPERFRAVVLEDPAWISMPADPDALAAGRAAFESMVTTPEDDLVALGRAMNPTWHESELGPWAASKRRFRGADQMADGMRGITEAPWRDVVARIAVPVLLVCGGDVSRGRLVTAEQAAEARECCPTLEVALFPEAGHCVRREAYDGYISAVRRFLAD
ncbi:MAG TPA: alpha/beta hydrolase [Acidimicrobiia bacterium]|nr:alpha/beta hydrolase [Acidimicrobiia bacterium]